MSATQKPSQVLAKFPGSLGKSKFEASASPDMVLRNPYRIASRRVVITADGKPSYDLVVLTENPGAIAVVWARDEQGSIKIGLIRQKRPVADQIGKPGIDDHPPVVFPEPPMGDLRKIVGDAQAAAYQESMEAGAVREMGEEMGDLVVKKVTRPPYPEQNCNPAVFTNADGIVFVEVDLNVLSQRKNVDKKEMIDSMDFVSIQTLMLRVAFGLDQAGALYRSGISLGAWLIFISCVDQGLV